MGIASNPEKLAVNIYNQMHNLILNFARMKEDSPKRGYTTKYSIDTQNGFIESSSEAIVNPSPQK